MKMICCFIVYELESMSGMIGCLYMILVFMGTFWLVGETCTKRE